MRVIETLFLNDKEEAYMSGGDGIGHSGGAYSTGGVKGSAGPGFLLQVVHLTIPDGVPRITRGVVRIPEVVFTGGRFRKWQQWW